MMMTQTMIHKIIIMDEQETFPTKTERIDELFKKVQNLESRILILESTIQMMRSNPVEPTVYGPGPNNPPWRQDYDLNEIVTMKKEKSNSIKPTVSRPSGVTSSRERMNPYDLGSVHKHKHKRR